MTRGLVTLGALLLVGCGGPRFDVDTPFAIAFTAPSHGALGIAPATDVRVGFNQPVDQQAARANIILSLDDDVPLEASVLFDDGDRVVVLVPVRALPAGETVTLAVGPEVNNVDGTDLDSSLLAAFTVAP